MGSFGWKVCIPFVFSIKSFEIPKVYDYFLIFLLYHHFRRHLALQKLDPDQTNDDNFLRKFHRNSKHEITAAEWAICEESQEYCAIATSQLIEVVTWRSGDPNLIHSLRAHTRVITDIDWHSKTPYLLASCSIDTFTHLWDLRDPKKPTMSLSAVCMCNLSFLCLYLCGFLKKNA